MDAYLGQFAALLAALGFGITSVFYTLAGRRVDSISSLAISLPISWLMVGVIHWVTRGAPFPTEAAPDRWLNLGASGVLAFVIASYCMLQAFQNIGPRLATLILSSAPVLSTLLAWIFLGQTLPPNALLGLLLVSSGIVWVVAERAPAGTARVITPQQARAGVIYACVGTVAQSTAFVFASLGVAGQFPPFSATLIRLTVGIAALWLFIALRGEAGATLGKLRSDARLVWQLAGAALCGPVISGSLVLLSFQFISVGVSTTLSHTTSIMLIPIGYVVFKERVTPRALAGTLLTVAGIALLFA